MSSNPRSTRTTAEIAKTTTGEVATPKISSLPSAGTAIPNVQDMNTRYEEYQVMPESSWPPPVFIKKNVTPQERYYMEHRWYNQWKFFDEKADANKRRYISSQLIVGIGSVTVPVLVGIRITENADLQNGLYILTVIISLSVAIAAAIEGINGYGDNWRSYRQAAEELHQEKSLYDVKAGRFADNPSPFTRFVERTEEIIAQQNGRFIQSVEIQQEQARQQADDFNSQYIDRDASIG